MASKRHTSNKLGYVVNILVVSIFILHSYFAVADLTHKMLISLTGKTLGPPIRTLHVVPVRHLAKIHQKYPIPPDDSKNLPVFEYPTSNKHYNRVFVWGSLLTGALGVPYYKRKDNPQIRETFRNPKRLGFAEKFKVHTAAAGFGFSVFAVDSDTNVKIYGTGLNTDSQIGHHAIRPGHPLEMIYFPQQIPLPFASPEKSKVTKISGGRAHLAVLTDREGLFMLGNNSYGQCGRPIIPEENYHASNFINHIPKINNKDITDIECGQDHTLALTIDGNVYSCGWGADGQTGLGHYNNTSEFTRVLGDVSNVKIASLSSRSDFALALSDQGEVFGWGNTEYGQIDTSNNSQQICNPTFLQQLKHLGPFLDMAAGGSFCLALNSKHEVYAWGFGILGAGPRVEQSAKPILIPEVLFGKNDFQINSKVVSVKCGLCHAMAVTNLGDVYGWGRNNKGCLGMGHEKDQFFPFKVSMGGYAKDVFCCVDHSIAICKPFI